MLYYSLEEWLKERFEELTALHYYELLGIRYIQDCLHLIMTELNLLDEGEEEIVFIPDGTDINEDLEIVFTLDKK